MLKILPKIEMLLTIGNVHFQLLPGVDLIDFAVAKNNEVDTTKIEKEID